MHFIYSSLEISFTTSYSSYWTFSLAITVETLQPEICRRERFFNGVGHFDRPLKVEGDVAHQALLCDTKLEGLPFHGYKNIAGRFFGLVTKHACDGRTDKQTDRQTDRITTPKTAVVLGVVILSVCPSVCPSVCHTRTLWLTQRTYRRYFIPHERAIILVFRRQRSRRNSNGVTPDGGAK